MNSKAETSFENLLEFSDETVKLVLQKCTTKELIYSLNTASPTLIKKIVKNLDKKTFDEILKGIKNLGPLKLDEVKREQKKITSKINDCI